MSILGIDLDGCLADFNRAYINLIVEMHGDRDVAAGAAGTRGTPVMFSTLLDTMPDVFPPCWHYPQALGYTEAEIAEVWRVIKKSTWFWRELWPLPEASDVCQKLDRLAQEGHDIYFITDRSGVAAKRQSELWLQRHGVEVPTVILASDKGAVAVALKLDAYIDDRNYNAVGVMAAVRRAGRLTRMYLKDAPYNRRPQLPDVNALPDPKLWDEFRDPGVMVVGGVEEMLRKEGL